MSWLTDNIVPIASIVAGGAATAFGGGAIGVPLMTGGLGAMGTNAANSTNRAIASDATNANMAEAARNRQFQADQVQQQMGYQSQQSNTAYQRSVADMTKAGINPMVAATNGGASTPSGSAASGSQGKAETTKVESALVQGLNSAMSMKSLMTDIDQKGSQVALNNAMATKALQDTRTSSSSAKSLDMATKTAEIQLKRIPAESEYGAKKAGYDTQAAGYDAVMSRLNRDSGTAKNVTDIFKMPNFFPKGLKGKTYIDGDGAINKF